MSYWLVLSYRTLFALSYWVIARYIQKFFTLSYWAFARKRSIHKFKACLKFFGFFAFLQKAQNDKVSPSLRALQKQSVAIHEFKCKFTFGLPRICTLTLCKFSQWRSHCHTEKLAEVSTCKALLWGKEKHITYENPCFAIK